MKQKTYTGIYFGKNLTEVKKYASQDLGHIWRGIDAKKVSINKITKINNNLVKVGFSPEKKYKYKIQFKTKED